MYQKYLSQFDSTIFELDGFTHLVSNQTEQLMRFFNMDVYSMPNLQESSMKIWYNHKSIVRIVEGCNALSVIILFISFVLAFTGKWWHTILFLIIGALLIHILNVMRIALLIVLLYRYPAQGFIFHDIVFPLIIYGFVFVLWIVWVNKFSNHAK